jgi:hypothetical protein
LKFLTNAAEDVQRASNEEESIHCLYAFLIPGKVYVYLISRKERRQASGQVRKTCIPTKVSRWTVPRNNSSKCLFYIFLPLHASAKNI